MKPLDLKFGLAPMVTLACVIYTQFAFGKPAETTAIVGGVAIDGNGGPPIENGLEKEWL